MVDSTVSLKTQDERLRKTPLIRKLLSRPELGAVAGAIVILLFFALVAGDTMFSARGIARFLESSALLGILAIPVALLMIGGQFDLSVGSMIAAAGAVMGILASVVGLPMWLSILVAFGFAAVVGYANGLIVHRSGLPSFIVTLAGLFILRGITLGFTRLITGRTQISGLRDLAEGDWLASLFSGDLFPGLFIWMAEVGIIAQRADGAPSVPGVPVAIVWWLIIGVAATWLLLRTEFGNWIFAVGGDQNAARNVGVPVQRVKIILFIMTAAGATLYAVLTVLDAGSADTNRGLLKEFEAIIAAVIGGCLLTGGYGSAIGAMFGALIFGVVQEGIFFTGIDTDWFKAFVGLMLLIAVLFNNYVRKRVTESR